VSIEIDKAASLKTAFTNKSGAQFHGDRIRAAEVYDDVGMRG
jgi:hypothetical protein